MTKVRYTDDLRGWTVQSPQWETFSFVVFKKRAERTDINTDQLSCNNLKAGSANCTNYRMLNIIIPGIVPDYCVDRIREKVFTKIILSLLI